MNGQLAGDAIALKSRWRRYPAYRDSGIEWLGEIPAHWEVKRLKYIARLAYGDSLPQAAREDGAVPVFGSNGSVGSHIQSNTLSPVIVVGRKGSFGKVSFCRTRVFAIDTTYFADPTTTDACLRWLFYTLQVLRLDKFSQDSAVPGLSREYAHDRWLAEPPLAEQRAIADFLDCETAKIDMLIAKNERLIELLQEKRAAIITRALTKGLDPDAPVKDSDAEWLGEIPAHWNTVPLKFVARFVNGAAFKPVDWGAEGTPIIRIQNLNRGGEFNFTTLSVDPRYHVVSGDLLFGWSGNRGTSFGPFIWRNEGLYYPNQHIFRIDGFSFHTK